MLPGKRDFYRCCKAILLQGLKQQKALQLPFHLRNSSTSYPYFWRQFSAILAASQLYFVDIPLIRSNIKGGSKLFSSQIHRYQVTKVFSWAITDRWRNFFVRKNASSCPLYCSLQVEYGQNKAIDAKNRQDQESERSSFSSEMEVAKLSAAPNHEVRFDRCNESAIKRKKQCSH